MAKFAKTIDIWSLSDHDRIKLQPGQYVTAGPGGAKGRFWGQRQSSTVVAWLDNSRGRGADYHKALRDYAKAGSTK